MSRSRGKLHLARICPWCGTPTIRRDLFNPAAGPNEGQCVSFICDNCHTGFAIKDSPRAMFVNRMYAIERAQRPPNKPRPKALMYKIGEIYPPGSLRPRD